VDPTKIEVSVDQPIAVHDVDEGLYSELHRELETIDRRVTRAHSRARSHTHVSLAVRARGRGRGRGCQIRRGSSSRVVTYARRGDRNASPDTVPVDEESGSSSSSFEELMEPEFDSDGNIVTDGDYGSASSTFEEESNSTSDSNSD